MIRVLLVSCLTVSSVLMSVLRRKRYDLSFLQSLIAGLSSVVIGYIGALIMGYIENKSFGPISYYGTVFIIPFLMALLAWIYKKRFHAMTDFITPVQSIAVAVIKLNCFISGCCYGRVIGERADGSPIRFPSQLTEMCFGLVLMLLFLFLEKKGKIKNKMYPAFLIIYGVGRFALNYLRDVTAWIGILPPGNFWSLIAIVIGVFWFVNVDSWSNKKDRTSKNLAAQQRRGK